MNQQCCSAAYMDWVQMFVGRLDNFATRLCEIMGNNISSLAILVVTALIGNAHAAALKPMSATYAVVRNGKPLGDASYSLVANKDGSWTLRSVTKGSAGMAKLLGLDVHEESTFRWQDGKPQGLHYDYKQDAAIKSKRREIDFDWRENQARVRDNGKDFAYAIPSGTIDRSTVAVALGQAVAAGARDATLPVAAKDHVEQQTFATRGEEKINVPAGSFDAVRVERTDAAGKARSWYAPNVTTLPIRVEQLQGDGSTIVMELKQR